MSAPTASGATWETAGLPGGARWPMVAGIGLALAVLAAVILTSLLQLRGHIFEQIASRDGEILTALAVQQYLDDKAVDETITRLEDTGEQIQLAFEISQRLHNVIGVRLFSPQGRFVIADPPRITEAALTGADLDLLRRGQTVSHFMPRARPEQHDLLAEIDSAPVPLLEINIPLREGGTNRVAGIAQFLMSGASIAREYADMDRHLAAQGALAFGISSVILTAGILLAFRRVRRANALLAERTKNLLKANRELALAAKTSALGAVTSHLIHGLKNPLSGLRSFVQERASGEENGPNTDWQLAVASTQRMQALIDRVVRVLQEQQTSADYALSFVELLEIITSKVLPAATAAGIEFTPALHAAGTLSNREADLVLLILENLLQNAIESTPRGKAVLLRVLGGAGRVQFEVEDQGPGLKPERAEHLFTPCASEKKGGSGIGLAISRQLAVHLEARLELAWTSSAGCCFRLTLPVRALGNDARQAWGEAGPTAARQPNREKGSRRLVLVPALAASLFFLGGTVRAELSALPNLVIVFTDDQGYADVGVFGARGFQTPNLDRLASQGCIFRNFHVAQPVCSASRAGLLTGCYPNRLGIHGALGPRSKVGLSSGEMTLAELMKQRGYATAIFGKWHLGDAPQFLPLHHGFDVYYGLPYSNDMWPLHPDLVNLPPNDEKRKRGFPDLVLFDGDRVAISQVTHADQNQLTTSYTEHAVQFIESNKDHPFFLYLAHNMPHVPLHVSDKFRGKTPRGLYGDVIEEIDWSVGQVMDCLRRNGLESNTWVIFTSDNGPWLSYGTHAGSAYPLREGKGTNWEGGTREPCIMRWPGKIPAGTESWKMLMTIDLLPTIARRIHAKLPQHTIDGKDVWPIISGKAGAKNPHSSYWFYYEENQLQAVVSGDGRWKLQLPHTYRTLAGQQGRDDGLPISYQQRKLEAGELYDLASDISETSDQAAQHPKIVKQLEAEAEKARRELGDALTKRSGQGSRTPGRTAD